MPKKLNLQFGALAPLVSEQLEKQDLWSTNLGSYDHMAYCVTSLHLNGLLTDNEAHKYRKRLLKKITAEVQPYE